MTAVVRLYRGQNHINFRKYWKIGLVVSTVLMLISVLSLFTRGLNLGIDFEGGFSWEVQAPGVTVEQTRDALRPEGLENARIQVVGSETIRVQSGVVDAETSNAVRQTLADLGGVDVGEVGVTDIGPTWGGEITTSALRALVVFIGAILLYVTLTFRGDWKMALGVGAAVLHDVLISVGVYSVFQFEVTPGTVIAFLTILGYSIYDTVVVYDKVQENTGRVGVTARMSYTDMVNLSMNQVLLRSINTSITSLLPVLSLIFVGSYLLGAVTLGEFAIALAVGLSVGTYSSIFVAAPLLVWMKEHEPRYRALRERLAKTSPEAGVVPAAAAATAAGSGSVATGGASEGDDVQPGGATTVAPPTSGPGTWNHPPRPRKKGKRR